MSIEENKALVRRHIEAVNKGDEAALTQTMSADFTLSSLAGGDKQGREDLIRGFTERLTMAPDMRATLIDLIAEGDKVVALGRDTGTPIVEIEGIKPTGKSFNMTWVNIYRIRNGQIVECIVEMNGDAWRQQVAG